jgi:hypothetical protein
MVPAITGPEASSLESEVVDMTKSLIVKLFWGSLIGLVSGLVLMAVSCGLSLSNDIFIMDGPDVIGIKAGALPWTLLALMALSMLILLPAAIVQFVAWIGAVLNTANLPDKTWFVVLLVAGLLGFVFIATVAYVIAGPDGLKAKEETLAPQQGGNAPQQTLAMAGPGQPVGSSAGGYPDQFA